VYDRGNFGVSGESEKERKMMARTRREKTGMDGRKGKKV
jgi:hypothetical protein